MKDTLPGLINRLFAIAPFIVAIASSTELTAQSGEGAKPNLEHQKMAVWAGDWVYEGQNKPSPFGPAGKIKGQESCKIVLNGFVWENRWEDEPTDGNVARGLILMRYDPDLKAFVDYHFGNDGTFGSTTNTVEGQVWTGLGNQTDSNGKVYPTRFVRTMSQDGRKSVMKAEYSPDAGKTWIAWWDAIAKKSH